jgi:hypothetical protein
MMIKLVKIQIFVIFCCFCLGAVSTESEKPLETPKTQVVIIGTIHDRHYENQKYPPGILKAIILELKPNAVLNELPLSLVDPNGRPIHRQYLKHPEGWASYTAAMELGGIPQIPFDRPDRQENFKKTNYFQREKQLWRSIDKWRQKAVKENPNNIGLTIIQQYELALDAQIQLTTNSNCSPEIINSQAYDSLIRLKHSVWRNIMPEIFKKYRDYESLVQDCYFFRDQWNERNRIMAENIIKAAKQYSGKRLVVITGAEHRYILRDLLKDQSDIELKEYWQVIDFDLEKCLKSIPPVPEVGIVADKLTEEKASQEVAKQYWQAVIKEDWELVNKLRPPVAGVNWKEKYSKNMPVQLVEVRKARWPKKGKTTGPLTPCVVKFENGKMLLIKTVPQFRTIRGKTICFIVGTWGKHREINDDKTCESN